MLKDQIRKLAGEIHPDVVKHRRHLHMHPELSFEEEKTSLYIRGVLDDLGISYTTGWAEHGIVAEIQGNKSDSKLIALRADMDALPIQEQNDVPYRSKNEGVMHACGHDVHTASLLGVASILQTLRKQFDGTVRFIFQPGEERMPGGASIMIKEGVLENPVPHHIMGQHVHPMLPAGHFGFRAGPFMASADEIEMVIKGKGGHGAVPQLTIDPIVVTAEIISALQTIVSRSADPVTPSVLTFGKINSEGGTYNVIPESVNVLGTFRTFDEKWRKEAHRKITSIATGVAESFGAQCDIRITVGYPFLVNHSELTLFCRNQAAELIGEEYVHDLPMRLTAEDFAYYSHQVPGCFYRLGVSNEARGITSSVHTPTFDIDESALRGGPAMMAYLTLTSMAEGIALS